MIRLAMPPSTNHLFANRKKGGRFVTKEYKLWRTIAGYALLAQRPTKFKGDVILNLRFGPRIANADVTNRIKPVEDLLVTMGVIEDDRFVVSCLAAWADVEGCEVIVMPATFNANEPIEDLGAHFAEVHRLKIASP